MEAPATAIIAGARDGSGKPFIALDIRYIAKSGTLYVFVMGWPDRYGVIEPLASPGKIGIMVRLESEEKQQWSQDSSGLKVTMPAEKPATRLWWSVEATHNGRMRAEFRQRRSLKGS